VNLFRTRFAKGEAKEIIAPQKLSGNGCSLSLQGKRCRNDYMIYNHSCGTDGALSRKQKHRNERAHFFIFCFFGTFAFSLWWSFSKFLWFFPSKERTEKKNFISDVLSRCQPDKLKLEKNAVF